MDSIPYHTHRICIVDDDAAVRDSMRALLESYGYEVKTFDSAAAFLGVPNIYCCLIVDLRMPVTNGLELLELLRMGGVTTPAILMTDKIEPTLAARMEAVGAPARLLKPIAEIELVGAIADACGERCAA
jgi:two-component system, LuxR family, response regulator FixJ